MEKACRMDHAGEGKLPRDLLKDILARLPVRSLLRFSCVSKSWHSLIRRDPEFAKLHLHHHSNSLKKPSLILLHGNNFLTSLSPDTLHVSNELYPSHLLPGVQHCQDAQIDIYGPCNGILCLYWPDYHRIELQNPSTGESSLIPRASMLARPSGIHGHEIIGFGFDLNTDDYKIVAISYIIFFGDPVVPAVDISATMYSLNRGCWRVLRATALTETGYKIASEESTSMNGFVYWWINVYEDGEVLHRRPVVLSFDLKKETFRWIQPPKMGHEQVSMFDYNGYLNVSYSYYFGDTIHIWQLNDGDTWVRRLVVNTKFQPTFSNFLGLWKTEEEYEIFLLQGDRELELFRLRNGNNGFWSGTKEDLREQVLIPEPKVLEVLREGEGRKQVAHRRGRRYHQDHIRKAVYCMQSLISLRR